MFFTLQRRFLILLLLPVTIVLLVAGVGSFFYARSYLLDQWTTAALLRLEKSAHQIEMRLERKREFMRLIAASEMMPERIAIQAYLARQLCAQPGVKSVEIVDFRPEKAGAGLEGNGLSPHLPSSVPKIGRMVMRMGPHMAADGQWPMHGMDNPGHMHNTRLIPDHPVSVTLDESRNYLSLVADFGGSNDAPAKRLLVTVEFNSFMKGILEAGESEHSYACLIRSDGTYLAHTMPLMSYATKMGESGDPLKKRVLAEIGKNRSGSLSWKGHPPHWVAGFHEVPTTDWYLVLFSRGEAVLAPIVRFRSHYMLAGMASLIFIGLLIRWNTRPVARSIARISEALAEVEKGDYSIKAPQNRSDELGQLARGFNRMAEGLRQRELIEETFGRYVDKAIAEELMSRPDALNLGGEKHTVTIMMSDLRGFTQASEKLSPETIIKLLNRHFAAMIEIIERHRGIIVDFFGDSVLAFFDGLDKDRGMRAAHAITCAVEMHKAHHRFTLDNIREELPALAMGIGIHTGEVIVGNIGSEKRAKYGIVGSAVNETDRIQSFAEGGAIIVSEQTYELVADRLVVVPKGQVSLKGLDAPRDLYEVKSIGGQTHLGE